MRARYYNPEISRFVNADPILDGLNWYAYSDGDPINRIDPSGLVSWEQWKQDAGDTLGGMYEGLQYQYGNYDELKTTLKDYGVPGLTGCGPFSKAADAAGFVGNLFGVGIKQNAVQYWENPTLYNLANLLTLGLPDTVKGAIFPEDYYGSPQNLLDIFGVATMFVPVGAVAGSAVRSGAKVVTSAGRSAMNTARSVISVGRYAGRTVVRGPAARIVGRSGVKGPVRPGIVNGKTPAARLADRVQRSSSIPRDRKPTIVAVIRTKDGKYVVGKSIGKEPVDRVIPRDKVQPILDMLGNKNGYGFMCAEIDAIQRALSRGWDLDGATISIARVRGKNSLKHGTYFPPCEVCQPLLDYLNITDIF